MNWDAIGAIAELVSATAVVATLIYLSTQVRQSIRISQAESVRSVQDTFTSLSVEIAKSKELRCVWGRLPETNSIDEFDDDERIILDSLLRALFNTVNHGFMFNELVASGRAETPEVEWMKKAMLIQPAVQEWWERGPMTDGSWGPRFAELVNREIAKQRSSSSQ